MVLFFGSLMKSHFEFHAIKFTITKYQNTKISKKKPSEVQKLHFFNQNTQVDSRRNLALSLY